MCFGRKPRPHPPSYSPTTNGPSHPYGPRTRAPNPYTQRAQGAAKILGHDPRLAVPLPLPHTHIQAASGGGRGQRRPDPTVTRDYHNTVNVNYRNPPKPPVQPTPTPTHTRKPAPVRPAFTSPPCAAYNPPTTTSAGGAAPTRPRTAPAAAQYARKPLPPLPTANTSKPLPPHPLDVVKMGGGGGDKRVAAAFAPLSAIGQAREEGKGVASARYVPYSPHVSSIHAGRAGKVGKVGKVGVAPQHGSLKGVVVQSGSAGRVSGLGAQGSKQVSRKAVHRAGMGSVPKMGKPPTRGERFARRQMRGSVWS